MNARRYKEVVQDFTQVLKLQPDNATILQNRSGAYRMLKDLDKSLEDLEKACQIDPNNVQQYGIRGALYMTSKKWNDTMINLNKTLKDYLTVDHL